MSEENKTGEIELKEVKTEEKKEEKEEKPEKTEEKRESEEKTEAKTEEKTEEKPRRRRKPRSDRGKPHRKRNKSMDWGLVIALSVLVIAFLALKFKSNILGVLKSFRKPQVNQVNQAQNPEGIYYEQ